MNPLDWIAASAAFLLLAIPVYWLVLHPFANFWRKQSKAVALSVASVVAWSVSGALVFAYNDRLFASTQAPLWAKIIGLLLLAVEVFMMRMVIRILGPDRLTGRVEMSGTGQLQTTGIYARLRHPSYAGMIGAMLGICLLAGTMLMWATAVAWFLLMRLMIAFEERELLSRFGSAYTDYRRRVPALLPFRFWPTDSK
jgi:protein-S-isoprenylcysteine O-methyltransferase Ste14